MTKRLWFIIGLVTGLLVGELLRRKQLQRLAILETQETERQEMYSKFEKDREAYIASLSTKERINWAMRDAERRYYDALDGIIEIDEDNDDEM